VTRALVFLPGRGAVHGAVDVYRDGDAVVCVGRVGAMRRALVGRGHVQVDADVVVRFPSVSAFDAEKARAFERHPEKYALAVGTFKSLDDDAREAPEIPERIKEAIDGRRMDTTRMLSEARAAGVGGASGIRLLGAGQDDDEDLCAADAEVEVLP
jgi:hypothetical protein